MPRSSSRLRGLATALGLVLAVGPAWGQSIGPILGSGGTPSGSAGGVLSGTYPDPGFAVVPFAKIKITAIAATGTFTADAHEIGAIVEVVGGGSGGGGVGGGATHSQSAGGGASGAYSRCWLTAAQIGATQTVTVPTAGTGGAAGANDGVAGGDVTFGSLCTAKGAPTPTGNGAATGLAAVGGTGGPASGTGTVKVQGNPGHPGSVGTSIATVIGSGGNGGAGPWGGAGLGAIASADGGVGTGCGSGGGGAASTSTNNQAGGDAAKGCAVVTEFLSQ